MALNNIQPKFFHLWDRMSIFYNNFESLFPFTSSSPYLLFTLFFFTISFSSVCMVGT